jgi:hypothetical protein
MGSIFCESCRHMIGGNCVVCDGTPNYVSNKDNKCEMYNHPIFTLLQPIAIPTIGSNLPHVQSVWLEVNLDDI